MAIDRWEHIVIEMEQTVSCSIIISFLFPSQRTTTEMIVWDEKITGEKTNQL